MPAFKETLMCALHDAVQHYNKSGDPNQAVIKAASAYDFNADQAARLLETFNTARTIYHYKTAADRTQEFQLADPTVVIPALFKEGTKKVEKPAEVGRDYSSYELLEAEFRDGMVIHKAAGVQDLDLGPVTDFPDTSVEAQADQAYRVLHVQRDLAKTACDEANVAATKASQLLTRLATFMKLGYEDAVVDRYSRLMSGYKDQVDYAPVMSKFAECMPAWVKKAAKMTDEVVDDRYLGDVVAVLAEAKQYMEVEAEMLAVADRMEKEANDFEAEWLAIIMPCFPQEKLATLADFIDPELLKRAQKAPQPAAPKKESKPAPSVTSPIEAGISKGVEGNLSDLVGGLGQSFTGPQERENKRLSERLKNVQRQIMLEDLMTTDPVLSTEDPQTVGRAYTAIMSMAPDVASNKEVVRAVLRQAVHSVAISPYEAEVWTQLEKNIRQLTGKMPMQGAGGAPKGK